jgi:hypothetical protein
MNAIKGYILIAEGDQGSEEWQSKFRVIADVQYIIGQLDSLGKDTIDWGALIGEFKYFSHIEGLGSFPQLYNLADFGALSDDFIHELEAPLVERPTQTYNRSSLYLRQSRAEKVTKEFEKFLEHLKSLPALKELF